MGQTRVIKLHIRFCSLALVLKDVQYSCLDTLTGPPVGTHKSSKSLCDTYFKDSNNAFDATRSPVHQAKMAVVAFVSYKCAATGTFDMTVDRTPDIPCLIRLSTLAADPCTLTDTGSGRWSGF